MANLPNLRRLFVEARSEAEENEYSRNAVRSPTSQSTNNTYRSWYSFTTSFCSYHPLPCLVWLPNV
ncbi:hypothetical protein BDW66DRAFT_35969 [Aspergillus desertorum]